MLLKSSELIKTKLLSLELLGNFPVGIGDHSTKDFGIMQRALKLLASTDERLETLEKYFNYSTDTLNEGPTYTNNNYLMRKLYKDILQSVEKEHNQNINRKKKR